MKRKYEKPKTKVVLLQGQRHLLQVSQQNGMNVSISGFQKGGNGSNDSDGWDTE